MATVRADKSRDYTTIANFALNDKNLSLKAKGLWAFIMSKPDEWQVSYRGLVSQLKEGQTAILATLNELEDAGYLVKGERIKGDDGKFKTTPSTVYEKPCVENPRVDNPRIKVNTDKVNTSKEVPKSVESVSDLVDEAQGTAHPASVLAGYYKVIKKYGLVVTNHNHVKKWAQDLEASLGEKIALLYLERLQQRDLRQERKTQEFVPALSTPMEICTKAPKIIEYFKRTKAVAPTTSTANEEYAKRNAEEQKRIRGEQ